MTQKKELRRRKKEQKKVARDAKNSSRRREFTNYLLNLTGSAQLFNKLPKYVKDAIYSITWPQIQIDSESVKNHPRINEIEENIKCLLNVIKIKINDEVEIPVSHVHGIVGIYAILLGIIKDGEHYLSQSKIKTKGHIKTKEECLNAIKVCSEIFTNVQNTLDKIEHSYINSIGLIAGQEVLKDFSLKEKCLYPLIEVRKNDKAKKFPAIVINEFCPKEESITIDNLSRKAYLCKAYTYRKLVDCVLPPNTVGNANPLPIYIQEHAIDRLIERVGIDPLGYIHDCVGRSLLLPVVSGTNGPAYLIDFDYYSQKIGYLVVTNEGDFAVVRSFKFLTMTGTPEFYKLKRELKGSREDFEYLGLDTLATFINSDISKDSVLREIFTNCGLGHLFNTQHFHFEHSENFIAEEIKQYFKLS
jgi:hypothetical protein